MTRPSPSRRPATSAMHGCLDCHYAPSREKGSHAFSRTPPSPNCTGGGRSTFVCHAGTMERRRGDSYLGKDFSEPAGLPEDVHVAKKIECVDCHQTGPGGMGHIERKATCQDCHIEVEAGHGKERAQEPCLRSLPREGPGRLRNDVLGHGHSSCPRPNPFKKYSLYYGPQEPPILIKDQQGRWMPTKIWPNSVGGYKETVAPKQGLTFRWPKGETRDAFVQLGTFNFPGGNNNYLAWLQVEEVAHPLGKSRTCGSCHASEAQIAKVTWHYFDSQGAEPFDGSQKVVADKQGLRVKDIKATSKITLMEGGKIENFAAWMKLGDIWKTSGDFSIPKSDPAKYRNLERAMKDSQERLAKKDRELEGPRGQGRGREEASAEMERGKGSRSA